MVGTIGAEVIKSSNYFTVLRKGSSCVVFALDTQSFLCVCECVLHAGWRVCVLLSPPHTHGRHSSVTVTT